MLVRRATARHIATADRRRATDGNLLLFTVFQPLFEPMKSTRLHPGK